MAVSQFNPNSPPLLSRSHPIKLARITAANDSIIFAMPSGDSYSYRGQLIIEAIPVGGTLTALTINVNAALDGASGPTFNNVPNASALNFVTTPLQRVDMSGLGAIQCQIVAATLTLNTATAVDIWATCG